MHNQLKNKEILKKKKLLYCFSSNNNGSGGVVGHIHAASDSTNLVIMRYESFSDSLSVVADRKQLFSSVSTLR